MPSNNIIPILHFGLAGRFSPASLLQSGDLLAGLGYQQKGFADTALKRQFLGRMSWDHSADETVAEVQFYPHSFAVKGSPTDATWEGGGDLDGSTTAIGTPDKVLALLFFLNVTRADAGYSAPSAVVSLIDASDTDIRQDYLFLGTGATAAPSAAAPWWGVAMWANNGGKALLGYADADGTGSDYLALQFAGAENSAGTIDVVMIAKGS